MITTALTSADDPTARPILSTAGKLGIPYFKVGYYLYEHKDVRQELARAGREFRRLVEVATECGVQAGFHNHSEYIGAAVWDAASFIEPLDPKWAGYYFDARHAVAEGGAGAWKTAVHLVKSRLKMVAVKDFSWVKTARGWEDANCPLGEGRVDWKSVSGSCAPASGPDPLHMEYEVPGPTTAERDRTSAATARDLAFLKARLKEGSGLESPSSSRPDFLWALESAVPGADDSAGPDTRRRITWTGARRCRARDGGGGSRSGLAAKAATRRPSRLGYVLATGDKTKP
jgi:sugar phosphate isomerase/epimerase